MTPKVEAPVRRSQLRRIFSWILAVTALSFVAWVVPIRDKCVDPSVPGSTKVSVTRGASGCVLHIASGDVTIPAEECDRLQCEPGLASTFTKARVEVLGLVFAIYLFGSIVWAARWRVLLMLAGAKVTLGYVWRITAEAQAGGILLPGGFGGDALRIAAMVNKGIPTSIVVASVMLDRVIGLTTVAIVAAGIGLALAGKEVGPLGFALAALPFFFVLGVWALRQPWLRSRPWLSKGRLGGIVQPVLAYVGDERAPRAIAVALGLSLIVSAVQFIVIRGIVVSLQAVPTAEKWIYVGSAMSMIVAAIPTLPSGWGTADAAYVYFLGLAGLKSPVALAVSLLFRLFWYILALVGAGLYLLGARPSPRRIA